jgi:RNA polymerase sigma factor (sigma-70 family)
MTNNQPATTPAKKSTTPPAAAPTPASTPAPALTQRSGRVAAYLGIMLMALGLLTAVTSYSPLAESISTEIGLTDVTYGLLGTVGPFAFAFVSLITPFVARRITLEWTIVIAALMIGAGQILRAVAGELQDAIRDAIAALPPRTREVFLMSRERNLRYNEIAEQLGVTVKAVEANMSRALRQLREKLSPFLPNGGE